MNSISNCMDSHELHLNLNGVDYHIRLTPQKVVEMGSKEGKKITLGMIMAGINYMNESEGTLEAHTTLSGKELRDWVRGGTFRERYDDSMDYSIHFLTLKLKGIRIEINEAYSDFGSIMSRGVLKTREHWYNIWKRVELEQPYIVRA